MVMVPVDVMTRPAGIFLVAESQAPAVGKRLSEIRRRKRFSIRGLARESGISASYIAQLESGTPDPRTQKVPRPTPTVLQLLADALGDGSGADADAFYQELMTAAGYLKEGHRDVGMRINIGDAEPGSDEYQPSEADTVTKELREGWDELPEAEREFLRNLSELRRQYRARVDREQEEFVDK